MILSKILLVLTNFELEENKNDVEERIIRNYTRRSMRTDPECRTFKKVSIHLYIAADQPRVFHLYSE